MFRWRLFGSGGPQVSVGCDDWLFLTEELRPWPDAAGHLLAARADILQRIAADLGRRGIAMQVVVVPDKARIEPERLCRAPYAAQARARYAAFMALLRDRGIATPDLAARFAAAPDREALYYRTDTHWSQTGAALAAAAVAAAVPPAAVARDTRFETRAAPPASRPGDLLRLMSLENVADWTLLPLRPRPDVEAAEHTEPAGGPANTGGLLDEGPAMPVVLIGSSFSQNGNFLGRLEEALRTPVLSVAKAGGGFAGAARAYFDSATFRESPPKLVIWEFPERTLEQKLGEDEEWLQRGV